MTSGIIHHFFKRGCELMFAPFFFVVLIGVPILCFGGQLDTCENIVLKVGSVEISEFTLDREFNKFLKAGVQKDDLPTVETKELWFRQFLIQQIITDKAIEEGHSNSERVEAIVDRMERHMLISKVFGLHGNNDIHNEVLIDRFEYLDSLEIVYREKMIHFALMGLSNKMDVSRYGENIVNEDAKDGTRILAIVKTKNGLERSISFGDWIEWYNHSMVKSIPKTFEEFRDEIHNLLFEEECLRLAKQKGFDCFYPFVRSREYFRYSQILDFYRKEILAGLIKYDPTRIVEYYRKNRERFQRVAVVSGMLCEFDEASNFSIVKEQLETNALEKNLLSEGFKFTRQTLDFSNVIEMFGDFASMVFLGEVGEVLGPFIVSENKFLAIVKTEQEYGFYELGEVRSFIEKELFDGSLQQLETEIALEHLKSVDYVDNINYEKYGVLNTFY